MARVKKRKVQNDGGKRNKTDVLVKGLGNLSKPVGIKKKAKKKTSLVNTTGPKLSKSARRAQRKKLLKQVRQDKDLRNKIAEKPDSKQKNVEKEKKLPNEKIKKKKPVKNISTFKVLIVNLPRSTTNEELTKTLNDAGVVDIQSLKVVIGKKKTYGIVLFKSAEVLREACNLNKKLKIGNRKLVIRGRIPQDIEDSQNSSKEDDEHSVKENEENSGNEDDDDDEDKESEEDEERDNDTEECEKEKKISEDKLKATNNVIVKNLDPSVSSPALKTVPEKELEKNTQLSVTDSKVIEKGAFTKGLVSFSNYDDVKAISFDEKKILKGTASNIVPSNKTSDNKRKDSVLRPQIGVKNKKNAQKKRRKRGKKKPL